MKQVMIALFSFMGITDIRYSGKERMFYVTKMSHQKIMIELGNDGVIERIDIPLTVGTFYGIAKRIGIKSPTAFALANGTDLVKG